MKPEVREAFRVTLGSCILTAVVQTCFAVLDAATLGVWPNSWVDGLHAAFAGAAALWLWRRQNQITASTCAAVFIPLALLYLPSMWLGELYSLDLGVHRDLVLGHEFLLFGVAALFPGAAMAGVLLVLAIAASAVALWSVARFSYGVPQALGEPWITFIYAGIAVAVQLLRAQVRSETRRLERARAEALALARIARAVLIMRDRANTPVQTLELGIAMLRSRCQERDLPLLSLLEHSTEALRELSALLPAVDESNADASWNEADADLTREIHATLAALNAANHHKAA